MTISYPQTETVPVYIEQILYEELFECEVEPYDDIHNDRLRPSQLHFIQGMLNTERQDENHICLTLSNDGAEYLLRVVLPENMERWYSKMDIESTALLLSAQQLLEEFDLESLY